MALGLVLGLVAVEGAARIGPPPWLLTRMERLSVSDGSDVASDFPLWRHWDPARLRFAALGDAELVHSEYRTAITFDEWGTRRTGGGPWEPGSGVLVLGDSFTFGVGVRDTEAWPGLWGAAVERPVLNLGVPGSTLSDQLELLGMRHAELGAPRWCVFAVFLGNDLSELATRAIPRHERSPSRTRPRLLASLNGWSQRHPLARRSYALQLLRTAALRGWNRWQAEPWTDLAFEAMSAARLEAAGALDALRWAVDRLSRQSTELGYTPLVVLIPDRYQLHEALRVNRALEYGIPSADLDPRLASRLVTAELERAGIPVVDLSACLAARGPEAYYQFDNHLTASGQAALAACAASALQPLMAAP